MLEVAHHTAMPLFGNSFSAGSDSQILVDSIVIIVKEEWSPNNHMFFGITNILISIVRSVVDRQGTEKLKSKSSNNGNSSDNHPYQVMDL